MNGYLPAKEACVKTGMTLYLLNKLINDGRIRLKETSDITKRRNSRIRLVCVQDIIDVQTGVELRYLGVKRVGEEFDITPNAVRYQIKHHRLRWRRNGVYLEVCISDLEHFLRPAHEKSNGSPRGLLGISRIVPAALTSLCNQFIVNGGMLDELTGVRDYRATSGVANYIGCYGSENDRADQLWEVKCRGTRQEDVFICKSPSMGEAGKTIKNDPYNAALWQGCDEVIEAENSCKQLEEKRMAGECTLHSEVVDGVFTFRVRCSSRSENAWKTEPVGMNARPWKVKP
ncbi:hypothetical protein LJC36_03080 [Desulfovibrio sp. OttesenSCG-928-C14]|nr:hypothetical protein [Desulfovibrio sp. OttesenSCG-928-C14]